jgi:hypothetical protein
MRRKGQKIAPALSSLRGRFRITHPFHPRAGEAFDLIRYARSWRREIVEGQGKRGDVIWLPVAWTDAGPEDPFLVMSKGRSWFRVEDLVRLVALIEEVRS